MRMRVDLPAPFSPTSAWISPGMTSKLTSSSARVGPKCLLMLLATAAGVGMSHYNRRAGAGRQRVRIDLDNATVDPHRIGRKLLGERRRCATVFEAVLVAV